MWIGMAGLVGVRPLIFSYLQICPDKSSLRLYSFLSIDVASVCRKLVCCTCYSRIGRAALTTVLLFAIISLKIAKWYVGMPFLSLSNFV